MPQHGRLAMNSASQRFATVWAASAAVFGLLSAPAVGAPTVALDNILVSKKSGLTNIQIWPACRMRYIEHTPGQSGLELRIRVVTSGECDDLLNAVTNEVYLPMGRRLGGVSDVRFDNRGNGEGYITLRFAAPQQFDVTQHAVGWLEVFVDTTVDSSRLPATVPPPIERSSPQPAVVLEAPAPRPAAVPRTASRQRQAARADDGEFVVQLGVFASVERAAAELHRIGVKHHAYTTQFELNGQSWHGLQIGFFDGEAQAEAVLRDLRASFPDSWVRHVAPAEVREAKTRGLQPAGEVAQAAAVRVSREAAVDRTALQAWLDQGRAALVARRYGEAVEHYTRVLEHPTSPLHLSAREQLGVALERSGQTQRAIAEYQAYLATAPTEDDARRVRERLTGLLTAAAAAAPPQTVRELDGNDGWQLYGGISQYYWRHQEQRVHDGNSLVGSTGVLALADVTATRQGERFDVLARANGAYQFNLVEFDERGDVGWISAAYVDVADRQTGLAARVGRQTRRADGVLDRFDGAALTYRWRPDISVSVSTGLPVDSPRFVAGDRFFYAFSAQIENLWDRINVNAYTHQQTVDGIDDRRAVGGEVQYRNESVNVVGLFDYDLTYAELNTALVNGTWLLDNGWRLTGSVRTGMQPYLTTRNALIGQTALSVDELLSTYTEGQVRTLARHRTAQATTVSVGVRLPLGERFDLSLDVSSREADGTIASGGVAALPATGSQLFYNASLIGTSWLRRGDLATLTLRQDTTTRRDTSSLLFDWRLPIGEGLRINPRLAVALRSDTLSDTEQLIASPSLRVIYRWRSFMIDLEAGGRWSSRELPPNEFDPFTTDGTEELLGAFVNLGYRWEF